MSEVRRFHSDKTIVNLEATLPHVEIVDETNMRDKFGNTIYRSPDLSYLDRENNEVKAALLISPEGKKLLSKYPDLPTKLDAFLTELNISKNLLDLNRIRNTSRVDGNLTIIFLGAGAQSFAFKVILPKEVLVLKVHNPHYEDVVDQPYMNEMLQIQDFSRENEDGLNMIGVRMPSFYMASGQVSLCKFETGEEPQGVNFESKHYALSILAREHIEKRRTEGVKLWNNIEFGTYHIMRDRKESVEFIEVPPGNYIQGETTLVNIDPFSYRDSKFVGIKRTAGMITVNEKFDGIPIRQMMGNYKDCKKMIDELEDLKYLHDRAEDPETRAYQLAVGVEKLKIHGIAIPNANMEDELSLITLQKEVMRQKEVEFVFITHPYQLRD